MREKIYRHALVVKKILLHNFVLHKYVGCKLEDPNLALLRANKRVNSEAEDIFYNENTFVIMTGVHMAAEAKDNPRLLEKFLKIRYLEIVYDFRDWSVHYMDARQSVREETADIEEEIERCRKAGDWMGEQANAYSLKQLMNEWDDMNSKKFIKDKRTPAGSKAYHDDQVENMGMFCYGHAMDLARDYMMLDRLILDYQDFRCYKYCCHLAVESMTWGTVKGWMYGPPRSIWTWGTRDREEERAILKAMMDKDGITFKCKTRRLKHRP